MNCKHKKTLSIISVSLLILYSIVVTYRMMEYKNAMWSTITLKGKSGISGFSISAPTNSDVIGSPRITSSPDEMKIEMMLYNTVNVGLSGPGWEETIKLIPGNNTTVIK